LYLVVSKRMFPVFLLEMVFVKNELDFLDLFPLLSKASKK
jgi:hypothetical protein